jgi:hypothetical protein
VSRRSMARHWGRQARPDVPRGGGAPSQRSSRGPCLAERPYVDPGDAGPFQEPERPVFVFDRDLGVLERAFYRHVRRTIDLDALFGLEQVLWLELQRLDLFTEDQVLDISNAILTRALERIANDPLRSMKEGRPGPGGSLVEIPEEPHGACPFCEISAPRERVEITQEVLS